MGKRCLKKPVKVLGLVCKVLLCLTFIVIFSENYLMSKGWHLPYKPNTDNISITLEPLQKKCGWLSKPGQAASCEKKNALETVWPNCQRKSRENIEKTGTKRVLLTGCSYTFGCGLDDKETYSWLLNKEFPNIVFDNYAVLGYSTYQSLMTVEYLLKNSEHKYDLVVYGCMAKHFSRNVIYHSPGPKGVPPSVITPFVSVYLDKKGEKQLHCYPADYYSFFLDDTLVTSVFLKTLYFNLLSGNKPVQSASSEDKNKAALLLINKMASECKLNKAEFLLLAYDADTSNFVKKFKKDLECNYLDLSFPDMNKPISRIENNINNHPNALVNKRWASQISNWIKNNL